VVSGEDVTCDYYKKNLDSLPEIWLKEFLMGAQVIPHKEKILAGLKGIVAGLQQLNDGKRVMLNSSVVRIFIGDDSVRVTLENFRKCQFVDQEVWRDQCGIFSGAERLAQDAVGCFET
jgi:hypothetical protein